jgi:hypothetical protein
MYRILPLRILQRTNGVQLDEVVPSDIPKMNGIDRMIHGPNSLSPGSIKNCKRPWYMHKYQDDHLLVVQGTRYVDIYCPETRVKSMFIITPNKIYKNHKLYVDSPAIIVWPAGIFHRMISGKEGSISINFATRKPEYDIRDSLNMYHLDTTTGEYFLLKRDSIDQPDSSY